MQVFASRGYAVLTPDAPIQEADEMRSVADVILPGVDRFIEMGIADSARVAVLGHSWGGYEVLSLLVQTTRFKAAVMRGGMGDLPAMYGEMESSGNARGQVLAESWMDGTLWSDQSRYIENSPIFYLDRVRTPLLIVHGAEDAAVPASSGDEVFVDLRRLGQEVEYARYAGEGHVEAGWSLANQKDYLSRVLRWFDDHLHPDAADRGVSEGVTPELLPGSPSDRRTPGVR
jgi:dipeptidyl aminopeptidase/acylaminoacyl peptidase